MFKTRKIGNKTRLDARIISVLLAIAVSNVSLSFTSVGSASALPTAIDGDLSDWDTSTPIVIDSATQLVLGSLTDWTGASDLSANIYVAWDADYLYIAAEVLDDTPFAYRTGISLDEGQDALLLYFSTNPADNPDRSLYSSTDFRLILVVDNDWFDTAIDRDMVLAPGGITTLGMNGSMDVLSAGYDRAVGPYTGGYTFEARIAWANFTNANSNYPEATVPLYTPQEGDNIKFNVELDDLDSPCPGEPYMGLAATGDDTRDGSVSTWGTLTLGAVGTTTFESSSSSLIGDANADGTINIIDALAVARYDAGMISDPGDLTASDANCDSNVNIIDALTIARYDAGMISSFC